MYISEEIIRTLIKKIDIVDIISTKISLKRAGANFIANCPFHQEKTPSFSVNQSKRFYYCFGCGATGDIIQFLIEFDGYSFPEAIKWLAAHAGVSLQDEHAIVSKNYHEELELYDILRTAANFYKHSLKHDKTAKAAIAYLQKRSISGAIAKHFKLGYAPQGWQALLGHFSKQQTNTLIKSGLVIEKNNKVYDRFRSRIIFPIRDTRGKIIAFGGRSLDGAQPKYLNSPDTILFKKRQILYGLFEILQKSRHPDYILIVEGYFDVVSLAEKGICQVAATLGTAVSNEHLQCIFKYTSEAIFCFDGDKAGQVAAWRALELCLPFMKDGRRVKFLFLPIEHDPDSYVNMENGLNLFKKALEDALPLSEVFFKKFLTTGDVATLDGKAQFVTKVKPYLNKLPEGLFKKMMFKRLAELIGEDEELIKGNKTTNKAKFKIPAKISSQRVTTSLALKAAAILLRHRDFLDLVPDLANLKEELIGLEIFKWVVQTLGENLDIALSDLEQQLPKHLQIDFRKVIQLVSSSIVPEAGAKDEFLGAMKHFEHYLSQQKLSILLAKANISILSDSDRIDLKELLDVSGDRY